MDEGWAAELVGGVLAEALREGSRDALVLAAPPSPAAHLLQRWTPELPWREPDTEAVAALARSLGCTLDAAAPWLGAGLAVATAGNGLAVHPAHKGELLLDGGGAPCYPLGDLWGHQLAPWTGELRVPRALKTLSPAEYREVEVALGRALEGGTLLAEALAPLAPPVREALLPALRRSAAAVRPPLIPRLSPWTPGLHPGF